MSAYGADREGRTLTEFESAARQAYVSALERECQRDRLRPPTRLKRLPELVDVIHRASILVITGRLAETGVGPSGCTEPLLLSRPAAGVASGAGEVAAPNGLISPYSARGC